MSDLLEIPLPSIVIDTDVNPRGPLDADRLQSLVDSIKRYGVLQPVLVRNAPEDGVYVLVAGQRRFTAAGLAGLTEIPAVVRDSNGDAAVALVENLEREQLSPIEEAHAFQRAIAAGTTIAELAVAISRTEQLIKDRLALLELPEPVQKHVDAGELGLGAAAALRTLAPAGDVVVAKTAELLTNRDAKRWHREPLTPRDLEANPAYVLDYVLDELARDKKAKPPFLVAGDDYRSLLEQDLPWPKTVDVAALRRKAARLPEHEESTWKPIRRDAGKLTEADLDAARAYGALLEVPNVDGGAEGWISDPVWLADRLNEKLDKAIAAQAAKAKKKTPAKSTSADNDARTAARDERAKQRRAMLAARERNVTLGIQLTKKLHAPKATADNMRLVAELLLEYAGEDLGRSGLRYVDETSQTVSTRKDGTISNVSHLRGTGDCKELVFARLDKAKTADEILGVLLQAIVAAHLADKKAAAQSDQYGSVRGLVGYAKSKTIVALADKIGKPFKPAPKVRRAP